MKLATLASTALTLSALACTVESGMNPLPVPRNLSPCDDSFSGWRTGSESCTSATDVDPSRDHIDQWLTLPPGESCRLLAGRELANEGLVLRDITGSPPIALVGAEYQQTCSYTFERWTEHM